MNINGIKSTIIFNVIYFYAKIFVVENYRSPGYNYCKYQFSDGPGANGKKQIDVKTKVGAISLDPDLPPIKLQDRQFIEHYANPESPTFGNATRSVMQANPSISYVSARTKGSTILADSNTQQWINAILEKFHKNKEVHAENMALVAAGKYETRVVQTYRDGDGNVTSTSETVHTPTASDIIRVNQFVAKVSGVEERNKAIGDAVSGELKDFFRQQRQELKKGARGK